MADGCAAEMSEGCADVGDPEAPGGRSGCDVSVAVVDEVDAYSSSVAGVRLEAVRTGLGVGPHRVLSLRDDRFLFTSNDIGFPFRSTTTIGDEQVAVATVIDAPPGSRWCSIDLEPGAVLVYGPGAEHTANNLAGARVTFAFVDFEQLDKLAQRRQAPIAPPPRGEVHQLARSANTRATAIALAELVHADQRVPDQLGRQRDDAACALVRALAEERTVNRIGRGTAIDSRRIVHTCIDYADATQRIPSIGELCFTAHVSERRLREAFVDEFSQAPSRFFRDWALQRARLRLRTGERSRITVSRIANDLGFFHLGRFAGHYRALFRETPSATLRAPARRVA